MHSLPRRRFLQLAGASLGLAATRPLRAIEPFARSGAACLRLSLAAYSFRDFFKDIAPADRRMTYEKFLDFCAEHGCEGAELTSYYFPKDVSDARLRDVRRHAFLRGVPVSGTSVGNTFTLPPGEKRDKEIADVKRWIDRAVVLGAPHIRVFAGVAKDLSIEEARRLAIAGLEECCAYAGERGIFLGLENHGGIVADPAGLLAIVRAVQSPWLGVNLDTGNFHTADPYAALAECAPYAVNVQIKSEIRPAGAKENQPADLARFVRILREAHYQGWVALEYEAKEDPWTAVPPLLAQLSGLLKTDAKSPAKDEAEWKPLFDGKTLDGWKVTPFAGRGDVAVQEGQIILEAGNDITGINFAGEPPKVGYELALEAKRLQGGDFFCALTFPVAATHVTLVVGGWGGSVIGISSLNGQDASENETTRFMKFQDDRWYRVRVRVTAAKVEAWLDDEQVADVDTEGTRLGLRSGEIELSAPLGIASYRTRSALRDIRMRLLK